MARVQEYCRRFRSSMTHVFRTLDQDRSGSLDYEEVRSAFGSAHGSMPGLQLGTEEWAQILLHMDTDGNGTIDLQEFLTAMGCFSKVPETPQTAPCS